MLFICQYCEKQYDRNMSYKNHEFRCPKNINRQYINGMTGKKGKNQFTKARELGLPVPPGTMTGKPGSFSGRKHTEETKKKISDIRIKYLTENPICLHGCFHIIQKENHMLRDIGKKYLIVSN